MKKALLMLMFLIFAVPAGAEVLIYNLNEKNIESENYGGWQRWTRNCRGYVVVEINGDKADAVFIETWTGKTDDGNVKFMDDSREYEFDVVTAVVNKKTYLLLTCGDEEYRVLLTGAMKPIGTGMDNPGDTARKLTGFLVFYDGFSACSASLSLNLNTKLTVKANLRGDDLSEAADSITEALEERNYEYF